MTGRERGERVSISDPRTRAEVYGGEPRGDEPELGIEYGRGVETGGDLHGALARKQSRTVGSVLKIGESRLDRYPDSARECRSMPRYS